jgi:membrane-associated protein
MDLTELLLHTDDYLIQQAEANLLITYLILFLIIFAESGSIFFPFLPGDGLLFSAGVVASATQLNVYFLLPLLILAAILGFIVNYKTGIWIGSRLINKKYPIFHRYYMPTKTFLDKHGKYSVIICRFFPIVRTYLPFVAGVVRMDYRYFVRYTVVGAFLWVSLFITVGFLLGEIPWVTENYGMIFLILILLTLLPLFVAFVRLTLSLVWLKKKLIIAAC